MVGCYGPRSKNGRRTTTVPADRSVCTGMPRPSRTGCCSDRCRRLDGQRGSAHGQPAPRLKHPEKSRTTTLTPSLPSETAEDGRWRGDVRPARQASRRPPPVLPRSKRNVSRSVLVSLVSDPQNTPSEFPPSCAPSRGPDGTGAAGSCVEVSPPEPPLRRLTRIIEAFDRTHSRA